MSEEKLLKTPVGSIKDLIAKETVIVSPDTKIKDILAKIIKDTRSRHAYIVDKNNVLIGSIRVNNVIQYLFPTTVLLDSADSFYIGSFMEYSAAKLAKDIMNTSPIYVFEDTPLAEMITIMTREKINELPVVDKNQKIIGEVNVLEIIAKYLMNNS
ncbi:MAG: CBS domain-containing protein [Candidatus Marinimicrobia bacterium]|nr:CBS domain-containing protein [Candidatus Neomarinimicrobiota bacterium]